MDRRHILKNLACWVGSSLVVAERPRVIARNAHTWRLTAADLSSNPTQRPDEVYMRRAIGLARKVPKVPFGALLVDHEKDAIVAEGWNRSTSNPTWHGEMVAINSCAEINPQVDWSRLTLYTTAEPCAMCQSAVAWAGITRVVFGSSIPYLTSLKWWAIDIRAEEVARLARFRKCQITGGVLEKECNELFKAASSSARLE